MTEFRVRPTGHPRPLIPIDYRDVWSATDEIEVPADQPDPPYADDGPPIEPVPTEGTPEDGVTAALFEDPEGEVAGGVEP